MLCEHEDLWTKTTSTSTCYHQCSIVHGGLLGQKNFSKSTSTKQKKRKSWNLCEHKHFCYTWNYFVLTHSSSQFLFHLMIFMGKWALGSRRMCQRGKRTVNLDGKQRCRASFPFLLFVGNISNQHIFDVDEKFPGCKSFIVGWKEARTFINWSK